MKHNTGIHPRVSTRRYTLQTNDISVQSKEREKIQREITVRGLCGLENLGNTCYINSILQCINNLPIFSAYIRKRLYMNQLEHNKLDPDKTITDNLSKLFTNMFIENKILVPKTIKILSGIKCDIFSGFDQNDSHEYLNFILDQIHTDIRYPIKDIRYNNIRSSVADYIALHKKIRTIMLDHNISDQDKIHAQNEFNRYIDEHKNDVVIAHSYMYWSNYIRVNHNSVINDLFTGLFHSTVKCLECNNISHNFEPFNVISVEIDNTNGDTLDSCITSFIKEEQLTDHNMYMCDVCNKKVNAIKSINIWDAPEYLIIHIKRFNKKYSNGLVSINKNNKLIKFPINDFNIDKYTDYIQVDYNSKNNINYDLCGISKHYGSYNSGHYTAQCRSIINKKWYNYDDQNVRAIKDDMIEQELVTKEAYILFYSRKH